MDGVGRILTLSVFLGVSSFIVGILPLSFAFSAKRRFQLSTFGNGLLLGAALGVIIPEGIEAVAITEGSYPTTHIALSLLVGFTFMLIIEQHLTHGTRPSKLQPASQSFPLAEYPREHDSDLGGAEYVNMTHTPREDGATHAIVSYPLTLGLVIHSLADGLALGASSTDNSDASLSLVVFFALIMHKAPAALGLTSSLMSSDLPRSDIRKHAAVFSAATPLGALSSFALLKLIGAKSEEWTGIALLVSGGTFLYVATVIQPIGSHSHGYEDSLPLEGSNKLQRVCLLVVGIFLPFAVGILAGHEHNHGRAP